MSGMFGIFGGMSAASQAEMETATSNTVGVTPLNANWHPGVAKAWLKCGVTGNILSSHNITSITDQGTGILDVTIATDFSSTAYIILSKADSASFVFVSTSITSGIQGVGSFRMNCFGSFTTYADPSSCWYIVCFGDQ